MLLSRPSHRRPAHAAVSTGRRAGTSIVAAAAALMAVSFLIVGPSAATSHAASARPSTIKVLPHGYVRQDTSYWCGPATARILIASKKGVGATPSQRVLANDLKANDGNGTQRADMRRVLNKHLGGRYKIRNLNEGNPLSASQANQLLWDVEAAIDKGYGIAVGILVKPNGPRPAWMPRQNVNVDHWMAVVGYDDINRQIAVVDPASWGKPSGKTYHWIKISDIARYTKSYVY